jgi:hypothetical protein
MIVLLILTLEIKIKININILCNFYRLFYFEIC